MTEVQRPPLTADERVQLIGWLDLQRSFVRMKCEGLSEEDAHRKVLETSPLMTMAGLVAHLRWNEYSWFQLNLIGVPFFIEPIFAGGALLLAVVASRFLRLEES